jgi:hypothetical protein
MSRSDSGGADPVSSPAHPSAAGVAWGHRRSGARRAPPSLLLVCLLGGCGDGDGVLDGGLTDGGPRLPAETADPEALAPLLDWRAAAALGDAPLFRAASDERDGGPGGGDVTLLDRGNRDANNFLCASEDAELSAAPLIAIHTDLPRCPDDHVRGFVLGRFEGSGRLVRLWMTTLRLLFIGAGPELLRVYVDDEPAPLVEVRLDDALSGAAGELFAPPFGAGSPHALAWRYPVVFGRRLVITIDRLGVLDNVYYQADVVLDVPARPGRRAATDRLPERDAARAALAGPPALPLLLSPTRVTVGATPVLVAELPGPATIGSIQVSGPGADALMLEATWDDAAGTLRVPLAHLGGEPLRLPMPFATRARLTLTAPSDEELSVEVTIAGSEGLPRAPWGHLTSQLRETVAGDGAMAHPVASARGRGRLAGVCMRLEGRGDPERYMLLSSPFNFLEGDERVVLDGRPLPATGTEDYFDSAFYFEGGAYATPFARAWDISDDGVLGRVSACRWHPAGEPLDFATSLEMELEIGPDHPALLERYRSVAFVYLAP